jgi:hypothetical protein
VVTLWDLPSFDIGSATLNHRYIFIVLLNGCNSRINFSFYIDGPTWSGILVREENRT